MATTENTEAHGRKQSRDEVCSARLHTDTDVVQASKSFHTFPSVAFRVFRGESSVFAEFQADHMWGDPALGRTTSSGRATRGRSRGPPDTRRGRRRPAPPCAARVLVR